MIKETTQLQGFPKMKLPKIKGTVEIKLHNPTTGKTEVHKGENMVTDAVADIFASNYCGALDYRKLLPLWSKMYGGVLCFNNQLDVSSAGAKKDYFIPDASTHTLTAHAGQTSFSSQADDLTRGIPSDGNVSVADGVVTLAWEWGLSAGNGTISSLALTHADVGDAGTGSTSQAFQAMKPVINASAGFTWAHTNFTNNNMILFVASDGYGYRFSCSGQAVTFRKIPFAYEETGLVALTPFTDTEQDTTRTVSTTTSFTSPYQPYFCFVKAQNSSQADKLWLFYNTTHNGTSVKIEEINMSTWQSTNHDINNLGAGIEVLASSYSPMVVPYANGFVYLKKTHTTEPLNYYNPGFLKLNLSNISDQSNLSATIIPYGGVFVPPTTGKVIVGKQYVINNSVIYPCTTDDSYNASGYDNISNFPFMEQKTGIAQLGGQYYYTGSGTYYVAVSKFYLGTKYNLASAVQKTASQSMIITYTLQEVAPNE